VAIANALQVEAARATPVLCRFKSRRHAKFAVAELMHYRIRAFLLLMHYFTMWRWPLTLWPWPLTLNICSVSHVTRWNSVSIEQSAVELLRLQCLTYDLEHVFIVGITSSAG